MSEKMFNVKSISVNGVNCTEIVTNKYRISSNLETAQKQLLTGATVMDLMNGVATSCLLSDYYPNVEPGIFKTTSDADSHATKTIEINCYNNDYFLASNKRPTGPIYFNVDEITFTQCDDVIIYISESFNMLDEEVVNLCGINLSQIKTSNRKIAITETASKTIKLTKA